MVKWNLLDLLPKINAQLFLSVKVMKHHKAIRKDFHKALICHVWIVKCINTLDFSDSQNDHAIPHRWVRPCTNSVVVITGICMKTLEHNTIYKQPRIFINITSNSFQIHTKHHWNTFYCNFSYLRTILYYIIYNYIQMTELRSAFMA